MPASARDFTTLAVERHDDGLAVLSFAVPDHGHNVLTPAALRELAAARNGGTAGT